VNIVGSTTTYLGHQFPELHGKQVRIRAVLRSGMVASDDDYRVTGNDTLARLGGVMRHDRLEIVDTAIDRAGYRRCALATELECFAGLANAGTEKPGEDSTHAAKLGRAAATFTAIARTHLHGETLHEQRRDSLDFHEVGVVGIREALEAAFCAGLAAAEAGETALTAPTLARTTKRATSARRARTSD
jgi:hypothetical protein